MSFTRFILGNRHAVWALVIATVVLGVVAYAKIPVRLFPDTAPPLVNVVTSWPGATATDVNRELTEPLEDAFAAVEGVAHTTSTSQDNVSIIQVEFQYGTNVRLAAVDIDNAVSRLGSELPDGAQQPRVMTFSTADRPIYTVGVHAADLLTARRLAEDVIGPRIQGIRGVAAVDVFGGRVPTVIVDVDPAEAEAHHVALAQVAAAIQTGNVSAPAGRLRTAERETMLRVDQRSARVESLGDRVIQLPDGGQLRVDSLATVRRDALEDDAWFSVNGQRAIALQVYRSEDANTVSVVADVRSAVAELERELPGLTFLPGEESASFTELSVSNLLGNVWQALLLASVLLFLFLGRARAALVTAFTMPLAFALTFALMWQLGMEFNMVTLSAVILAVGMVVDAAVVVLENIVSLRDQGVEPVEAAVRGADEVQLPVLAGVATTVVVLFPLLSLPGFVGKVFGPLATTLLIAFSASVVVALVMVPILSLYIRDDGPLEAFAAAVSRPFQALMNRVNNGYGHLLNFGLRWRSVVLLTAFFSFVLGVAGLRHAGMNLLPRMDGGTFTVALQTPSGSSLAKTTSVVKEVERVLSAQPEVVLVQSQAGFEPGMKFAGGSGVMGPTQGFISVTLTPRTSRDRTIWQVEQGVREEIAKIPDIANAIVKEVGNTAKPTTLAPIIARVSGPDPLVLDRLGDEVVARLSGVDSLVQPTRTWHRDMERVLVQVDERAAASLGQTPLTIARTLAAGAEGVDAGMWSPETSSPEPIKVRFAPTRNAGVSEHLSWPMLSAMTGEVVPVRAVTEPVTVIEQALFTSKDLSPVLDILAEVDGRPLSFVVADANAALADLHPPEGYRVVIEGENKDMLEARVSILTALAVSVLVVYLLLVAQFRSWVHPITIMMAVPLSLVGVSFALWLAGKSISMPVMIGLVLLVGTVVNNSILLVDVIRHLREQGVERRDAIRQGVRSRFRPIMMTSLSTVVGMLPLALELALGAERFSPLATAVIGGLLASTLLTMVVIPVLYDIADSFTTPRAAPAATAVLAALLGGALLLPGQAMAAPLSLDEAWTMVQQHPAAVAAELRADAAQARAQAATGRLLPEVELQARTTKRDPFVAAVLQLPITLPDGSSPEPLHLGEDFDQASAVVATLTQPLYAGGALLNGRRAAVAVHHSALAERDATEATLWLGLTRAWYGYAVAEDAVAIRREVVDAARSREASLERLLAEGRAVELQLSAVALKRAEAEQALAEAEANAASAKQGLTALLGETVELGAVDVLPAATALSQRPASTGRAAVLVQADARAEAAEARGRAVTGAILPSLALRATAQYANPDLTEFPVRTAWGAYWDASLVLSWKLDTGVRWSEARGARLDAQAARAGYDALARQTDVELSSTQAAVALAGPRLDVAAERVRLGERALAAAEAALDAGRVAPVEVMEREADLAMARAAQLATALDVVLEVETARSLAGAYGPTP